MSVIAAFLSKLLGGLRNLLERDMRESLTFSASQVYPDEMCDDTDMILVRLKFCSGLLQTHIKAVGAVDCEICRDVDYIGGEGDAGELRHRPEVEAMRKELLTFDEICSSKRRGKAPESFFVWIRPPEGTRDVKIFIRTDAWIPPPPQTLRLY